MNTADRLRTLLNTKEAIKLALIDKGLNPTDEFASYSNSIRSIESSKNSLLAVKFDRLPTGSTSSSTDFMVWATYNGETIQSYTQNCFMSQKDDSNLDITLHQNNQYINNIYINFENCSSYLNFGNLNSSNGVVLHFGRGVNTLIANGYSFDGYFKDVNKCICHEEDYTLMDWIRNNYGWEIETTTEEYPYKNGVYFEGYVPEETTYESAYVIIYGDKDYQLYADSNGFAVDVAKYSPINSMSFSSNLAEVISFPDTSIFTNMENMFYYSKISNFSFLKEFNTSNVTSMDSMFLHIEVPSGTQFDLSGWDTSKVTSMFGMFREASSNSEVIFPEGFGRNCTNMNYMFYYASLPAIYNIDWSSLTSVTDFGGGRKMQIKNLGTQPSFTDVDFSSSSYWGVDTSSMLNCKQTVIDTLITYSFDRATAGYSTCNIRLSSKTKALLTEEEITQITAKGYTIT